MIKTPEKNRAPVRQTQETNPNERAKRQTRRFAWTDVNDKKRSDPKRALRQEKQGEEMRQKPREAAQKRRLNQACALVAAVSCKL
jgi:hypothetical protein